MPGQQAIAFFTRGPQFVINPDNTGYTGAWLIDPNNLIDELTVLVYLRANGINSIYQAVYAAIQGPFIDDAGGPRYGLDLHNIQAVGITENNWSICAQTGSNPVRYFNF